MQVFLNCLRKSQSIVYCDPKEICESKDTIVKTFAHIVITRMKLLMNDYEKQNEDLRLIAYKLLVDNFNEKYSSLDEASTNSSEKLYK